MADKRRCAADEKHCPKTISKRKKTKGRASADVNIGDGSAPSLNRHKKKTQTSLLSFWGKNLVRNKTDATKAAVTKTAQRPKHKNIINTSTDQSTVVITLDEQDCAKSPVDVKHYSDNNGKFVKDKDGNQKNPEKNKKKTEYTSHQDVNPGSLTDKTPIEKKALLAITPCKSALSPTAETNEDTQFRDEKLDDKVELKPIEFGNDATDEILNENNGAGTSLSTPNRRDDDDAVKSSPHALSDYEKLRLRNIKRNNARLAALGLLTTPATATKPRSRPGSSSNYRRKRPKIHQQTSQEPVRRSSRNRNPKKELNNVNINNVNISTSAATVSEIIEEPETEEEERYTVSPLLQYEMSSTERNGNDSVVAESEADISVIGDTLGGISPSSSNICLTLTGPRFVPPKGLNAIYSLEFWRNGGIESSSTSKMRSRKRQWLVGAGKSGMIALWDTNTTNAGSTNTEDSDKFVDPVLSWKAHGGRWIADAKFLPGCTQTTTTKETAVAETSPSRLITAGNDGTVCLWDLSTVCFSTGAPRLLHRTGKSYHSSGIFCMDTTSSFSSFSHPSSVSHESNQTNETGSNVTICTGSKDKSIAVSSLESLLAADSTGEPLWRSRFHTAKVGAVKLKGHGSQLVASASDDGLVALHDFRANECASSESSLVAKLEDAHCRPHSVLWDPCHDSIFVTAGLDPIVKVWDQRNLSQPLACLQGHVPTSTGRCKKIHRPVFFDQGFRSPNNPNHKIESRARSFLVTGGQGSSFLSVYQLGSSSDNMFSSFSHQQSSLSSSSPSLFSRGKLPVDCGDSGCIAVNGKQVAVAVDKGEIIILEPSTVRSQ